MKKIFFTLLLLFLFNYTHSQKSENQTTIIAYVESIINSHVTFVSWYKINDTIKVNQFRIYDFINKKFIDFYEKDITEKFPKLRLGFTLKTTSPLGSSVGCNVNNLYYINPINLFNRSNIYLFRHTNVGDQISPRKLIT